MPTRLGDWSYRNAVTDEGKMSVGDITILESVSWDWFASCTVQARDASDVFLKRKAFALLRAVARYQHVHFSRIPWALRLESGVDPVHRHFHFLIGSLRHIEQGERFRAMNTWNRLLGGTPDRVKGTCRVRLYEPAIGLAGYLAKELNAAEVQSWLRGDVMLSHAAARIGWRNARMRVPLTA
jgi:hypothetical protein